MFDEAKVKEDLEKMRAIYKRAVKKLNEIKARQDKVAKLIYKLQTHKK